MFLAVLVLIPALAGAAQQPSTDIGDINFPNSGTAEAQASFLRGVAALYNFWFDEAADEFKNAQEIDANFAMAYWGEAMSYNHPLWAEQDIAAAQAGLNVLFRDIRLQPFKHRGQRVGDGIAALRNRHVVVLATQCISNSHRIVQTFA